MNNVQDLIDKLTNAISFKFKDDGTSPGLTISRLRRGYYCSVVRYTKGALTPGSKVVVCKAESDILEGAVKGVAQAFLNVAKTQPDPLQALGDVMRDVQSK